MISPKSLQFLKKSKDKWHDRAFSLGRADSWRRVFKTVKKSTAKSLECQAKNFRLYPEGDREPLKSFQQWSDLCVQKIPWAAVWRPRIKSKCLQGPSCSCQSISSLPTNPSSHNRLPSMSASLAESSHLLSLVSGKLYLSPISASSYYSSSNCCITNCPQNWIVQITAISFCSCGSGIQTAQEGAVCFRSMVAEPHLGRLEWLGDGIIRRLLHSCVWSLGSACITWSTCMWSIHVFWGFLIMWQS